MLTSFFRHPKSLLLLFWLLKKSKEKQTHCIIHRTYIMYIPLNMSSTRYVRRDLYLGSKSLPLLPPYPPFSRGELEKFSIGMYIPSTYKIYHAFMITHYTMLAKSSGIYTYDVTFQIINNFWTAK